MQTVRAVIHVDAPRDRVWALYDDIPGTPAWVPFSEEILFVSGPAGVGTVYRERTRLGGIADVGEWTITEHEPPRRQVHVSTDMGMHSTLIIEMAEAGTGTRLAQRVELSSRLPSIVGWAHEVVFAVVARHGIRAAVRGAARHLDPATSSPAVPTASDT